MEPFFLRCETCRARLRVRDERFLGQVQSCPKCGSMVQILAPAGWLAAGETTPASEAADVAAVESPSWGGSTVDTLRQHAVLWSTGAAVAVMAGGLVAYLALRDGEEVAALSQRAPAVEVKVAEPSEIVKQIEPQVLPPTAEVEMDEQMAAATPPVPKLPLHEEIEAAVAEEQPLVVAPAQTAAAPVVTNEQPRTLTLEPVVSKPRAVTAIATAEARPDYPPAIEEETGSVEARLRVEDRPWRAAEPPARVTNFVDQLAVPIESIDLPAMPIGKFVNLLSDMAAVPIELDAKVLGEVGLSTRSTVTVRGDNTTVGKLLARVLKENQLTCVERDGVLVVVKAKR